MADSAASAPSSFDAVLDRIVKNHPQKQRASSDLEPWTGELSRLAEAVLDGLATRGARNPQRHKVAFMRAAGAAWQQALEKKAAGAATLGAGDRPTRSVDVADAILQAVAVDEEIYDIAAAVGAHASGGAVAGVEAGPPPRALLSYDELHRQSCEKWAALFPTSVSAGDVLRVAREKRAEYSQARQLRIDAELSAYTAFAKAREDAGSPVSAQWSVTQHGATTVCASHDDAKRLIGTILLAPAPPMVDDCYPPIAYMHSPSSGAVAAGSQFFPVHASANNLCPSVSVELMSCPADAAFNESVTGVLDSGCEFALCVPNVEALPATAVVPSLATQEVTLADGGKVLKRKAELLMRFKVGGAVLFHPVTVVVMDGGEPLVGVAAWRDAGAFVMLPAAGGCTVYVPA